MKPTEGQPHTRGRTESKSQYTLQIKLNGKENSIHGVFQVTLKARVCFCILISYAASSTVC